MRIWKKFHRDAIPEYLARHYWWAYLWKVGVWFFDHQWIINLILFGKYRVLVHHCLQALSRRDCGRTLQLTCVYGSLTPSLYQILQDDLHIADIAEIQLRAAQQKLPPASNRLYLERMNAEQLAFASRSFDTVLMFFLLHELPPSARNHVLGEIMRVLKPHSRLVVVEYGERGTVHLMHRWWIFRVILGWLEPFLPSFWSENLEQNIRQFAHRQGREIESVHTELLFNGFYRVVEVNFGASSRPL